MIVHVANHNISQRWAELEQQRLKEENEFLSFLTKLLIDHRDRLVIIYSKFWLNQEF